MIYDSGMTDFLWNCDNQNHAITANAPFSIANTTGRYPKSPPQSPVGNCIAIPALACA
jgi:hypothetical protein